MHRCETGMASLELAFHLHKVNQSNLHLPRELLFWVQGSEIVRTFYSRDGQLLGHSISRVVAEAATMYKISKSC